MRSREIRQGWENIEVEVDKGERKPVGEEKKLKVKGRVGYMSM